MCGAVAKAGGNVCWVCMARGNGGGGRGSRPSGGTQDKGSSLSRTLCAVTNPGGGGGFQGVCSSHNQEHTEENTTP